MSTSAAVGRSLLEDAQAAGRAAAEDALAGLPNGTADLLLVFATASYAQPALIEAVGQVGGPACTVGCSGEGVIAHGESAEQDYAVAVMAVRSDRLWFEGHLLEHYTEDPGGRGAELGRRVAADGVDDLVGLLVFPDGLTGNCTELLQALSRELPQPIGVAGGTSADGMRFDQTYQYGDGRVASDGIAALAIRGAGRMELAVSHGCAPIGLERVVTRAEGGWVYEIDGKPAWSVFKEYLAGDPQDLNAEGIVHLCLGERLDSAPAEGYTPYVIRTPLNLNKDSGALFFPGGGLHTDQKIRLTRRDQGLIRQSARACAQSIVGRQPDLEPALVLQFDCAGRGRILFGSCAAQEIVQPLQRILGPEVPWLGFHTYGEIAPIDERLYYHNYTVVLCAVFDGE